MLICSWLAGSDNKSLRLASRHYGTTTPLRIPRVFLSPNPLNIRVFLAAANHDVYRHGVGELIYDDARLAHTHPNHGQFVDAELDTLPWLPVSDTVNPVWFYSGRRVQTCTLRGRFAKHDHDPPATPARRRYEERVQARLSPKACVGSRQEGRRWICTRSRRLCWPSTPTWTLCGMVCGAFPNLRKVTVTPTAHGFPFNPRYDTPMIRAFPVGFSIPTESRLAGDGGRGPADALIPLVMDQQPNQDRPFSLIIMRCFCGVLKTLAENNRSKSSSSIAPIELAIEGHPFNTGLSIHFFAQRSPQYDELVAVLAMRWPTRPLAHAPALESMSLETDLGREHEFISITLSLPLHAVFPACTRLRHFRLWNCSVRIVELVRFLSDLPRSLVRAELGDLHFQLGESYYRLLEEMRTSLAGQHWERRPNLCMGVSHSYLTYDAGTVHMLETEVDEYLYHQGPNPFCPPRRHAYHGQDVHLPMGVLRDMFDPDYEEAWARHSVIDMDGNHCISEYAKEKHFTRWNVTNDNDK